MPSDENKPVTLRFKEWTHRKTKIMGAMADIVETIRVKLDEILPDIQAIREKKLYIEGGYENYDDFCRKVVGVTSSRICELLQIENVRKSLEINPTMAGYLPFLKNDAVKELKNETPETAAKLVETAIESHPQKKATAAGIKNAKKAKARTIDAETHEPVAAATILPTDAEQGIKTCLMEKLETDEPKPNVEPPIEAATRDFTSLYMELVSHVERVFPNETRHQTALRYIKEAEVGEVEKLKRQNDAVFPSITWLANKLCTLHPELKDEVMERIEAVEIKYEEATIGQAEAAANGGEAKEAA